MAFTITNNLVFIDSMQFMNSSLDSLVKNLSEMDFRCLSQEFSGNLLKLVKQKGVYPYKYMDCFKTFPDKNYFIGVNLLVDAINVCNTLKMNLIGEYHDLYSKTDVLVLADVFEKFINTCLEYHGSDPCQYFSSSGFCLKCNA